MKLNLYQIFYNNDQILDKGCIPYSNVGVDASPYFENEIIRKIYNNGIGDCDYVGVTSWRMNEKTGLTYEKINQFILDNPGYDVYSYGNYGSNFNLMQNSLTAIGIAWKIINNKGLINSNNDWINIFCNFWIIKKSLLPSYIDFLSNVINIVETDEVIKWICSNISFPHRGKDYPVQTMWFP